MQETPIQPNKSMIESFCRKYHIVYLAFFGSILTTEFTKNSDVDVLVKFEDTYVPHLFKIVGIEAELSEIIGRTVDLRTPNDLSPYFRDDVLAKAKVIYGN